MSSVEPTCPVLYKQRYFAAMRGLFLLATPLLCFVCFCILRHSTPAMKTLKWMLFHQMCWLLLCEVMLTMLVVPVLFAPVGGASLNGILNAFGVPVTVQAHLQFSVIGGVVASSIAMFENRFNMAQPPYSWLNFPKKLRIALFAIRMAFLSNMALPVLFMLPPEQQPLREQYAQDYPCLAGIIAEDPTIFIPPDVYAKANKIWGYIVLGAIIETLFYSIGSVICLRRSCEALQMSEQTRKMQRVFLKAIILQEVVPWLLAYEPKNIITLTSSIFGPYTMNVNNVATFTVATHGLWSSITLLIVIRPYREFVLRLLRIHQRDVANATSILVRQPSVSARSIASA